MGTVPFRELGQLRKARSAGEEGLLTPEQRDFLRKQIDVRVRERLSERSWRGASPGGYVSSQKSRVTSSAAEAKSERVSKRSEGE